VLAVAALELCDPLLLSVLAEIDDVSVDSLRNTSYSMRIADTSTRPVNLVIFSGFCLPNEV
jgi:hypothetical protein